MRQFFASVFTYYILRLHFKRNPYSFNIIRFYTALELDKGWYESDEVSYDVELGDIWATQKLSRILNETFPFDDLFLSVLPRNIIFLKNVEIRKIRVKNTIKK